MGRSVRSLAAEAAFRARLAELGATLLEPEWLGTLKPHRVRCATGHECTPRPNHVIEGIGICRSCARNDPAFAEAAFRARLAELGVTLLEPEWLGANVPHRILCAAGHECAPRPHGIARGKSPCRTCASRDSKAAEAAFRARLAELGATLLEPEWLGVNHPHRVLCAAGHECGPHPASVAAGRGICRICAGKAWDVFYVVADQARQRIKFGITSGDPRDRLGRHALHGYAEVVRLAAGLPGSVAPDMERAVLATLRLAEAEPIRGREYYDGAALAVVLDVVDNWGELR